MGSGEGSTRARLESVARQTGKVPKELEELAELPESMKDIWKYFLDLNRKRGGGFGPSPLQHSEILAYFTLHRIDYDGIELYLIDMLDDVAMGHFAEQNKQTEKAKRKK